MKRISTSNIRTDESMKVKRRTLVITSCIASSNSKGQIKEEKQASFDHVTVQEGDDLEAKVEPVSTAKKTVDGGGIQHSPTNDKFLEHYFS